MQNASLLLLLFSEIKTHSIFTTSNESEVASRIWHA